MRASINLTILLCLTALTLAYSIDTDCNLMCSLSKCSAAASPRIFVSCALSRCNCDGIRELVKLQVWYD